MLERRLDARGNYTEEEQRDVASWMRPDGTIFSLPRYKKIGGRKLTVTEEDERVLGTTRLLEAAGVKPSQYNLKKRGVGAGLIAKVRKRQKSDE